MQKRHLRDNIIATNAILEDFNPSSIALSLAQRVRLRRLELNLTQNALAKQSGVSLGSLKRFENSGEISLKSLIKIAIALNAQDSFKMLFSRRQYYAIKDVISADENKGRKRGRKNV